ncbi:methionyl-tRNA formyltransferase [Marinobacterium litorale]|uniref:methionyl-tRNA formyltransferase n=1 Tax=Marinobacterium litorale TaxID=404770 RepID=UPI000427F61D|nr:methionyl-tRNA formyltransferase [Marinobacterium litorale]
MPNEPLKIIFAGTPDFAAASLSALLNAGHNVIAVYTQPDRPAGRGRKLTASPVKQLAEQHELPVYQPQSLRDEAAQAELAALKPDLMVVAAYGLILPREVLNIPSLGCINVHASLLPRWRGAAPIHRAVLAGDRETGITIMQMEAGLDTGPMLLKTSCEIGANETSGELHDRLSVLGGNALCQALEQLKQGTLNAEPQDDSQATYAHKLEKAEGALDWSADAETLARQIRGLNPWPVAYTEHEGKTLRVWAAHVAEATTDPAPGTIVAHTKEALIVSTGSGRLALTSVQLPGGKPTPVSALLNAHGKRFAVGSTLG